MSNFRVPYLVGDKLRRDHQYWPTILKYQVFVNTLLGNRLFDLERPLALTLAQIQVLFWRVREWTVSASSWTASSPVYREPIVGQDDIAEVNDTGSTPEFKFRIRRYNSTPPDSLVTRDIADDKDMLAEWRNRPSGNKDYSPSTPPNTHKAWWKTLRNLGTGQDPGGVIAKADSTAVTWSFNFTEPYSHAKFGESGSGTGGTLVHYGLVDDVIYDPASKLFYPYLVIDTLLPFFRAGRNGVYFYLLPLVPAPLPPPEEGYNADVICGVFTLDFGGTGVSPVTCQIARQERSPQAPSFTEPLVSGNFSLTMTATKFWPCKNSLGEPVYDEDTGAQINNPFA